MSAMVVFAGQVSGGDMSREANVRTPAETKDISYLQLAKTVDRERRVCRQRVNRLEPSRSVAEQRRNYTR